ncbi:hypothetical protein T069G_01406 [Trichoderma breve]|uniref:Uncharacterized protein n=1 Tax=Trichoderma breve TaxID=2034170 RepID=A0A9W9EE11_9HYPO|nr:hypothetical protein T069G_01406 [Trichoderma breve]KAJ4864876.1 hypothetical protein T069G_01406 [Trichoderma breve]
MFIVYKLPCSWNCKSHVGSSLFGDAPHKLVQGTPAPDVTLLVDTTWTYEMALQGIKTGFGDSRIGSGEVCGGRDLAAFVLIMLTGDLLRLVFPVYPIPFGKDKGWDKVLGGALAFRS